MIVCCWAREHMNKRAASPGGQERESFPPWDCINLGLGQTTCLFKRPNQLFRFLQALDGPTSQPILSFPRLDWQASLVKHPPAPFWLLLCMCPRSPAPTWPSGTRMGKGAVLLPLVEQCCNLLGCEAVASWPVSRLMFPILLSSMFSSFCSSFIAKYQW